MGKKQAMNVESAKKDRFVWNQQMDDALVEALYAQHVEGNRVDGNFTTKAYDNIVDELQNKLGLSIDKYKVKNRMKSLKTNFNECYDIFKSGLSGFSWSATTRMWSTEEEIWDALIKQNSKAAKWKHTPIGNYHKLCDLFGKDRATGEGAATAKEKCKRWAIERDNVQDSSFLVDELLSRNNVVFENDTLNDDIEILSSKNVDKMMPGISRRGKKKRVSPANEQEAEMIAAMKAIATSLNEGMQNQNPNEKYIKQNLWNDLKACGAEQPFLGDAYMFLAGNSDKLITFLGFPEEQRFEMLLRLMDNK